MKLDCDTQSRYTPDPGTVPEGEDVFCGVCGDKMDEKRGCNGPRGFAMAMSGSKSPYDSWTCPNREEPWHQQVVALRNAMRETPSAKIALIMAEEVGEILSVREQTKDVVCLF